MKNHKTFYSLLLLMITLCVCILLVEIVLRKISTTPGDTYYVWPPNIQKIFNPSSKIMPGVTGPSRFTTNPFGIRGDTFSDNIQYHILAIGGSTTECLYLDDHEAWPYLLQEKINNRLDYRYKIWVGNVGLSGRRSIHHAVVLSKLLQQYPRINAVIILSGANDLLIRLSRDINYRPLSLENPKDYETALIGSFIVCPKCMYWDPFYKQTEIWRRLKEIRYHYFSSSKVQELTQDESGNAILMWREHRKNAIAIRDVLPDLSSALEEYAQNLNHMVDISKSKGIRIIFLTQPSMWHDDMKMEQLELLWTGGLGKYQSIAGQEYYSVKALSDGMRMYNDTLLGVCQKRNVECLDLDSLLSKDTSVFYDDIHFNESGSREVSDIISEYLLRLYPFNK